MNTFLPKRFLKGSFFLILLFFVSISFFAGKTLAVSAEPELRYPCDSPGLKPEFHSLRPYQAAACGDANKALYCSNEIQFVESFDLTDKPACKLNGQTSDYWCDVNFHVEPHDLYIELDNSMFPIMGNTEQVKNGYGGSEEFDDATKVNEYASWYLSGVNGRAEYGEPTESQVVNYSGPLKKLLPSAIQDATRVKSIVNAIELVTYPSDNDEGLPGRIPQKPVTEPVNHDQIVVCEKDDKAVPCPQGKELRLKDWGEGSLSLINTFFNWLGTDIWNKKYPPLPWQFVSQILYQKAYYEWQGKNCAILPVVGLQCVDSPVSDKWADLYQYIPLSNTTDKGGANYIIGDGPDIQAARNTTVISDGQFKKFRNAPLYFAHTQEVRESSELLNKTYQPEGFKSEKVPETTEENYCSAVNIRMNPGDNLFPGDPAEMQVNAVEYNIDKVLCTITTTSVKLGPNIIPGFPCPGGFGDTCEKEEYKPECNAQAYITLHTGTKTPNAEEIFSSTVADSGSTFRKIFPKVEEGAPVSCIADIPTVTGVDYDPSKSQKPKGGTIEQVKITNYPDDDTSGIEGHKLTFPHIGSVYEYFLHGIQTALRPKGFGQPIADGTLCKPAMVCGDWESKLGGSGGACGICNAPIGNLAKKILTAAGTAYQVPAANIWAAMKHEGADGYDGTTYDFDDENVRKWSNPVECGGEPMPHCDNTIDRTQPPFGFLSYWFYLGNGDNAIWSAVQKIDPTRDAKNKVSRCNFLDAAFAAAKSLRQGSSNTVAGPSCGAFTFDSTQPATCEAWNTADNNYGNTKIAQSQVGFMGQCPETSPFGPVPFTIATVVGWEHAARCEQNMP